MERIAASLFYFSGIAALVYQVTWLRLLGFSVGTAAVTTAATLAACFMGLALGSLIAQWRLRKGMDGLRGFAVAEGVTAVSALALLPLLFRLDTVIAAVPWVGSFASLRFSLALLVLLLPSAAIGATFPFLAAWVARNDHHNGERLGSLYAFNTLGAMSGALLAGFLLIPKLGLDGAIQVAAAINGVLCLAALVMIGRFPRAVIPVQEPETRTAARSLPLLLVLAVTGFTAMAAEVVWTKYLAIYSGTTIYGFAATLAVFLFGIALGSWLIRGWLRRRSAHPGQLAVLLAALAGFLVLTRAALGMLPSLIGDSVMLGEALHTPVVFASLALVLLPASLCFGALLPLTLDLYCRDAAGIRRDMGSAYAVNTLASVAGAVAAGLWLVPALGSDMTLQVLPLLPLAAALMFLPALTQVRIRRGAAASLVALALGSMLLPGIDYRDMLGTTQYRYRGIAEEKKPHFQYLAEGQTGVISLVDYGGSDVYLQKNGIKEAVVVKEDARKGSLSEALLGALPYLLQENAKNALVIGFGGGTTARVLAESGLDSVKVVEIEPKVVTAMMLLGREQFPFLQDGRVTLEYNDARNSLLVDKTGYDIIVSQPSHPWLAGSANLYSHEFFKLAHSRLRTGGVFGQWVNLFNMDATTLRSILRTFYDVFPRGVVFGVMAGGDLLLMGSDSPLVLDYSRTKQLFEVESIRTTMSHGGLSHFSFLPTFFLFTRDEAIKAAGDVPLSLDSNLLVEVRLALLAGQPTGSEDPAELLKAFIQQDVGVYMRPDNDKPDSNAPAR